MTWEISHIFTRSFENVKIGTFVESFYPKQKMYDLKIYRQVICNDTEDWCKIWRKTDLCFPKWHEDLATFYRLKNSDFVLESKMAELNQNQNSKQIDQPDAVWKIYFILEINE